MQTGEHAAPAPVAGSSNANVQVQHFAIGDRVGGPVDGIVVDVDDDAVVVAQRNTKGRCMEVIFVGAAANALRRL